LFFRFGWNHRTDFGPPYFPDNILASDGADVFERGNIAAGFGDTWIKTSRTVVDLRLGLTRYFDRNFLLSEGIDLTTLGFPASYAKAVQYSLFPTMQYTDTKSVGSQTPNKAYVNQIQPSVNIHSVFSRGLHPFFVRDGETQLSCRTQYAWRTDAEVLPIERIAVPPEWDFSALRRVDEVNVDSGFEGWDGRA